MISPDDHFRPRDTAPARNTRGIPELQNPCRMTRLVTYGWDIKQAITYQI